jgi:hypothetical protein
MDPRFSPDPVTSTAIVWIGLLIFSLILNAGAIVVAIRVWATKAERSEGERAPLGDVLVLVGAGVLAVGSALEVIGALVLSGFAMENFAKYATLALLPVAFGVFAYAVYGRR